MENEIIKTIKTDCDSMRKLANGDYSEIKELEKNPAVIRYLYLTDLRYSHDIVDHKEKHITDLIIEKYGSGAIKETNNIWCYLYDTAASRIKDVSTVNPNSFDDNEVVAIYRDIEDSTRIMAIKKEEKESFEASHKVVFGDSQILDGNDRYYNTRRMFFDACIKESQEEAVEKLLTKCRNNGSNE